MKTWSKELLKIEEQRAIDKAHCVLKKTFPVKKIILFGSKSRGDDDIYSDIDLLIITSKTLHWKEEKKVIDTLFDIGMEFDAIFSTLFVSVDEWEGNIFKEFPIYEEIMKDGVLIA